MNAYDEVTLRQLLSEIIYYSNKDHLDPEEDAVLASLYRQIAQTFPFDQYPALQRFFGSDGKVNPALQKDLLNEVSGLIAKQTFPQQATIDAGTRQQLVADYEAHLAEEAEEQTTTKTIVRTKKQTADDQQLSPFQQRRAKTFAVDPTQSKLEQTLAIAEFVANPEQVLADEDALYESDTNRIARANQQKLAEIITDSASLGGTKDEIQTRIYDAYDQVYGISNVTKRQSEIIEDAAESLAELHPQPVQIPIDESNLVTRTLAQKLNTITEGEVEPDRLAEYATQLQQRIDSTTPSPDTTRRDQIAQVVEEFVQENQELAPHYQASSRAREYLTNNATTVQEAIQGEQFVRTVPAAITTSANQALDEEVAGMQRYGSEQPSVISEPRQATPLAYVDEDVKGALSQSVRSLADSLDADAVDTSTGTIKPGYIETKITENLSQIDLPSVRTKLYDEGGNLKPNVQTLVTTAAETVEPAISDQLTTYAATKSDISERARELATLTAPNTLTPQQREELVKAYQETLKTSTTGSPMELSQQVIQAQSELLDRLGIKPETPVSVDVVHRSLQDYQTKVVQSSLQEKDVRTALADNAASIVEQTYDTVSGNLPGAPTATRSVLLTPEPPAPEYTDPVIRQKLAEEVASLANTQVIRPNVSAAEVRDQYAQTLTDRIANSSDAELQARVLTPGGQLKPQVRDMIETVSRAASGAVAGEQERLQIQAVPGTPYITPVAELKKAADQFVDVTASSAQLTPTQSRELRKAYMKALDAHTDGLETVDSTTLTEKILEARDKTLQRFGVSSTYTPDAAMLQGAVDSYKTQLAQARETQKATQTALSSFRNATIDSSGIPFALQQQAGIEQAFADNATGRDFASESRERMGQLEAQHRLGQLSDSKFRAEAKKEEDSYGFVSNKLVKIHDDMAGELSNIYDGLTRNNGYAAKKLHQEARDTITNEVIRDVLVKLDGIKDVKDIQPVVLSALSNELQSRLQSLLPGQKIDFTQGKGLDQIARITDKLMAEGSIKTVGVLRSVQPLIPLIEEATTISPSLRDRSLDAYRVQRYKGEDFYLDREMLETERLRFDSIDNIAGFIKTLSPELEKGGQHMKIASAIGDALYGKVIVEEKEIIDQKTGEKKTITVLHEQDGLFQKYARSTLTSREVWALRQLSAADQKEYLDTIIARNERSVMSLVSIEVLDHLTNLESQKIIPVGSVYKFKNLTLKDVLEPVQIRAFTANPAAFKEYAKSLGLNNWNFSPDSKIGFTQALSITMKQGMGYEALIQKIVKKQTQRQPKERPDDFWKYANLSNPISGTIALIESIDPNRQARKAQSMVINLVPNTLSWGFNLVGADKNMSELAWAFHTATGNTRELMSVKNLGNKLKQMGIPLDRIEETGIIPDNYSVLTRIKITQYMNMKDAEARFKAWAEKNPKAWAFVQFLAKREENKKKFSRTFLSQTKAAIMYNRFDILPKFFAKTIITGLTNRALILIPGMEFDPKKKAIVFRPLEDVKDRVKVIVKGTAKKVWDKTGGRVLHAIWDKIKVTAVGKAASALAAKILVSFIPVVGQALGIAFLIDGILSRIPIIGEFYKLLKNLIKIGTLYLLYLLYQLAIFLIGIAKIAMLTLLWINPITMPFMLGATLWSKFSTSLAAKSVPSMSVGMSIPTTGSVSVGISNGITGWLRAGWSSVFGSFSLANAWAIVTQTASAAWAALMTMPAVTLAGLVTLIAVPTFAIVYTATLMAALKDPIDKLIAVDEIIESPLQLTKSGPAKANNGDNMTYKIKVVSPACSAEIVIKDLIPGNTTFVKMNPSTINAPTPAGVTITDPSGPQNTGLNGAPELTWTINVPNPSGNCSGVNTSAADGLITKTDSMTVDQINAALAGTPIASKGQLFLTLANQYKINPAMVIGIFSFETQLGRTGPGMPNSTGVRAPGDTSVGCNNLGNMRNGSFAVKHNASSNTQACRYIIPNTNPVQYDGFAYFTNYDDSIAATFDLINSYYNNDKLQTIQSIADKYIPVKDRNQTNNPNWVARVTCTIINNRVCSNVTTGSGNGEGPTVNVDLSFDVKVTMPAGETEDCITNTARGEVGPISNSSSTTASIGGKKCSEFDEFPSDKSLDEIIALMCSGIDPEKKVRICPTINKFSPPKNGAWTKNQLNALWNIAQKIKLSPTYRNYAIGNYVLEVSRSHCYPLNPPKANGECSDPTDITQGFHASQEYPSWNTLQSPLSRLITIADTLNTSRNKDNIPSLEYLFAHEIGHAGNKGTAAGTIGNQFDNPVYKALVGTPCKSEAVSTYGQRRIADGNPRENFADAVSFYMTAGERYINGSFNAYIGFNKDLKTDHPCVYNELKNGFFPEIEYANN